MRLASCNMDLANDLASLWMSISTAMYMVAPRRVNATVFNSVVGCGIKSSTVVIAADARAYLETLSQGKLKSRHLRAMAYLTISMAEFASRVIRAR